MAFNTPTPQKGFSKKHPGEQAPSPSGVTQEPNGMLASVLPLSTQLTPTIVSVGMLL